MTNSYDVVVIGGGAAGLSGALTLGRARRSVLVVDSGSPRNAPADGVHNYLGREGTPPGELLAIGRREVEQYGVEVVSDTAITAVRRPDGSFAVTLSGRQVSARRLLVATGIVDVLPDVPGIAEGWGTSVIHCPYCHGWEVQDEPLGILATGAMSVHQALLFRQWSSDVVFFSHLAAPPTAQETEQFEARGIPIIVGEVAAWEGDGMRMASGEFVARRALVVGAPFIARSDVLAGLGLEPAEFAMNEHVMGTHIPADPTGLTTVPGVWVAGNLTSPFAQVIASAAAGLMAAAAINGDLIAEETQVAVERLRVFSEAAWDERYLESDGPRWSGAPNPSLVAEVESLPAGSAIDVGCGEGADAIWLAERGWRVTGTDISSVALERAAAQARSQGLDVQWQHSDMLANTLASRSYDLVTAHYIHLPQAERMALYTQLAAAVAPGGSLLLVGHHPSHMHSAAGHPNLHDMYFTAEQLVDELDLSGWEICTVETRARQSRDHDGNELTIEDAVLRARRSS